MWLAALLACTAPDKETGNPQVTADKLVILVLDGVRVAETFGDGVTVDGTPTEDLLPETRATLFPRAAWVTSGIQLGATSTIPGHCDLLSGRTVQHAHFTIRAHDGPADYIPEWPTLIQAFLAAGPGRRALITGDTAHTEGLVGTLHPAADGVADWEDFSDGALASEDDAVVIDELIDTLHADDPYDFILANLHAMDSRAHQDDEAGYLAGVRAADTGILRVWKALQQDPDYADRTLLVITSDHGRHALGGTSWYDHGDACAGCREVPILLVGPGVAPGVAVATPYALIDVAPTLAHLLGVPLPFAEGLVMGELLDGEAPPSRTGFVDPTGVASVELTDDPAARSRIVTDDGVVLSDPLAVEARGPVWSPESELLCWRELGAPVDGQQPWRPTCASRTDGRWVAVDHPGQGVDPWWRPALAQVGGTPWVAWGDNPTGGVAKDDGDPDPVRLARLVDGTWELAGAHLAGYFPTDPALVPVGDSAALLAFAASDSPAWGRYTRRARVYRVAWGDGDATFSAEQSWSLEAAGVTRQERVALRAEGDDVALAFLGYGAGATSLHVARSADGGATWTEPTPILTDYAILPHVAPVFDGRGRVWWAAVGEDATAWVCMQAADGTGRCDALGAAHIDRLAPTAEGVRLSVASRPGQWTLTDLD
jgi:hypothetical protein